jgi:cell fate regulator YaaT (PSP1 superfamily)
MSGFSFQLRVLFAVEFALPIYPLPQFEADLKEQLAEEDRKAYEALKAPKTLVVRYGSMKLIGEFQHQGTAKPGCGSKVVVRTFRGVELGEMLTSTCPNSGCSKSVSRQDMLQYIENSGGSDYPFYTEGKVLRIATKEDIDKQAKIEQSKHELKLQAKQVASRFNLPLKIVEVEPILGGDSITVFFVTEGEQKIEVRDVARELGQFFRTRVEMRNVGARDEARLTADYEKCGQYCCCKNFLKVLKPVSMKSAKVQKATLDPLKISGRCGRLMCCLRYEDETYESLAKKLPRKKTRVGTSEGDGTVIDGQILTQLVLVLLDEPGTDGKDRQVAIPVENLLPPKSDKAPVRPTYDERDRRGGPQSGGGGAGAPGRGDRPRGDGRERPREPRRDLQPPREDAAPASKAETPEMAPPRASTAGDASEWGEDAGANRPAREAPAREGQPREGQSRENRPPRDNREQRPREGRENRDGRRDGPRDDGGPRRDDRPRESRGPKPGNARDGQPRDNPPKADSVDDLMGGDLLADDPMRGNAGGPDRGQDRGPRREGGGRRRRRRGGGGGGGGGPRPGGPQGPQGGPPSNG